MSTTSPNTPHAKVLSEYQSKKMLAEYGIPVALEKLAQNKKQAIFIAEQIGFPVALKACSPKLMHKTDAGGLALNLMTRDDVARAYDEILRSIGDAIKSDLEGMLVSKMIPGERELLIGLTREAQFGPCVMLGLGGVMTEIFNDSVFRVAPFDRLEAEDMIRELKSRAMLNAFRGEGPADIHRICQCLISVGQIGLDHPDIVEIDINPLKIASDGQVWAVDALLVFRPDNRSK